MAAKQRSPDELLRAVEHHHEQYIKNLRALHEIVSPAGRPRANTFSRIERAGSSDGTPSPVIKPTSVPGSLVSRPTFASDAGSLHFLPVARRARRLTNETDDPKRISGLVNDLDDEESDETDDDDEDGLRFMPLLPPSQSPRPYEERILSVQKTLSPYSFTEDQLVKHLKDESNFSEASKAALGETLWRKRNELTPANLFLTEDTESTDEDLYASATFEVYNVGPDSLAVPKHDDHVHAEFEILEPSTVWESVKSMDSEDKAVGRMTILQEPSPLMLASIHKTMSGHFDMEELFQHLVTSKGNKGKSKAYMHRAFEKAPNRQRSFFFVFKYYAVVGEGLTPYPWQLFDDRPPDFKSPDHIDITECSSILALSLEGPQTKEIQFRSRRRRTVQRGALYDTFAPWHLLSIQCFPDDEHSLRSEDSKKPFYNGPYAFLDSLAAEYRDAVKRNLLLTERITKLTTPPNHFMFDAKLRDKLLFEDKYFTYSRRYFWAYNTLGVINDGIKSMIAAYTDTFTADFWAGRHSTLWPVPEPDSTEGRNYLLKMESVRHELERAVRDLRAVCIKNDGVRQEIMSLREQLFSGSSVKESRRAIEQGDNIKILTSVSMVFLPLTFVTSVFGITEFTISASDWRFPVTMVAVCVPFFLLILVLQTRSGMSAVKKVGHLFEDYIWNSGDRATSRRERQLKRLHASSSDSHSTAGSKRRMNFRKRRRHRVKQAHEMAMNRRGSVVSDVGAAGWWSWRRKRKAADGSRGQKDENV